MKDRAQGGRVWSDDDLHGPRRTMKIVAECGAPGRPRSRCECFDSAAESTAELNSFGLDLLTILLRRTPFTCRKVHLVSSCMDILGLGSHWIFNVILVVFQRPCTR